MIKHGILSTSFNPPNSHFLAITEPRKWSGRSFTPTLDWFKSNGVLDTDRQASSDAVHRHPKGRLVPGSDFKTNSHCLSAVLSFASLILFNCSLPSMTAFAQASTPKVTVSGSAQVRAGGSVQFYSSVSNSADKSVIWKVNGVAGGSSATGTISNTGLYTAAAAIPSPASVSISAVSHASAAASATQTLSLLNPLPALKAVTGTRSGTSAKLLLDAKGSGFAANAQILAAGSALATTHVSATELQAVVVTPPGTSSLAITVANPNPGAATTSVVNVKFDPITDVIVTLSGPSQVRAGGSLQFTASVVNSSDTHINWQVNGVIGGSAATGTISNTGLYQAASSVPSPASVSISAVSHATSLASASRTVSILNALPVLNSASATSADSTGKLLIDVRGSGFAPTAQIMVAGTPVTTTLVSGTELQAVVAPAAGATTLAVSVSNPNPGAAVSASVKVNAVINSTLQTATRLLDQATFGPTLKDIQHVEALGPEAFLAEQFKASPTYIQPLINPTPASCVAVGSQSGCLNSLWWQAALTSNDQLRQRVAFALSQIFVVSTITVNPSAVAVFQNLLLKDAFGNFSTVLHDVTVSAAMGQYLDMLNSAAPRDGQIANENYAREVLQLFTIGLYELNQDGTPQLDSNGKTIPSYTQTQIQALARAFTGWTYATPAGAASTRWPAPTQYTLPLMPVAAQHDQTAKILLNGTTLPAGQTAEQDLDDALANIFTHQNVGPFICRQLIQHLVSSNPSPAYVSRVAAVFADNGNRVRGDLQAVIQAILLDPEARAGDTDPSSSGGHLREPVLYLASTMRALSATNTNTHGFYGTLSSYTEPLGESPYASSSVFNFFPPDYQLPDSASTAPEFELENTATSILRLTLANTLVHNYVSGFNIDLSATSNLGLLAANPSDLVDSLGVIFLHGQMPAAMRTAIINHIATLSSPAERARVATYLVITSSVYKVQH